MKQFNVYPLMDIELVKAEGNYVWDKTGNKYLDLYGGHAVISIGHAHSHYNERLKSQLDQIPFYSNSVVNSIQNEFTAKLGEVSGYADYSLFQCNSGAEATENAVKLASFHTGRKKLIAFHKGFHGRTARAVSITDSPKYWSPIDQGQDVDFYELNDTKGVEASLKNGDVCAVIIEGIQGIGGIHVPEPKFLESLSKLCKEYGTVLILDEIQSGYGRSGKFFAHQYANIRPDIITVAKGMGNGFPIGGILISPMFEAWFGMLGSTFGGNHLACAAGLAVLEVLEKENLLQNACEVGDYLTNELKGIPGLKEVRGHGLMIGLEFEFPIKELRTALMKESHILTGVASNPNVIRLLPALSLSKLEASLFLSELKKMLIKLNKNEEIHIS